VSEQREIPRYKIHPALGIARLGNSPDEFCISPETPAALPIACDAKGNPLLDADGKTPLTITKFKDSEGRIRRQAARFQVYVYDEQSPEGRPLELGDSVEGGGNHGKLVDIQWRVYLANKKSAWYEFQQLEGEHGYLPGHPLRNAAITDTNERQTLIIDPGPRVVDKDSRSATFHRADVNQYSPTFPPENLLPRKIDTLGALLSNTAGQLLVLGGHGNSGSYLKGLGQPRIDSYANTDGWFDDTSDGPVMARLIFYSEEVTATRYVDVEYPAWVVCAYPAYVPEILDMITLDDVVFNTAVTQFAYRTNFYGKAGTFTQPQIIDPTDMEALALWQASNLMWNTDYKPWFFRDIWPILFRADEYTYLTNVLQQSNYPHNQTKRGNFDVEKLQVPPQVNEVAYTRGCVRATTANQSGELFMDELDAALMMLDLQIQTSKRFTDKPRLLAAVQDADIRTSLLTSLKEFAAVAAGGVSPEQVSAYVAQWEMAYASAQEPESDSNEAYLAASANLKGVLKVLADQLSKQLADAETTEQKHLLKAAAPVRKPPRSGDAIGAALDRLYTAYRSGTMLGTQLAKVKAESTVDPYLRYRTYLYDLLRKEGEENVFRVEARPTSRVHHLPLMPLLSGDNPISNDLPSKFLRLTDVQLYLLRQWMEGKFFNEIEEGWVPKDQIDPWQPFKHIVNKTGRELDQNVLANLGGGAFCPGAEVGWIIRNPSIYVEPYRLKADPSCYSFQQTAANQNQNQTPEQRYIGYISDPLSQSSDYETGLQPGDLTKMMALPWQADFNECSTQDIDVTYELWNKINPSDPKDPWMKRESMVWETLWWPAHRPMQVFENVGTDEKPNLLYLAWAQGVPQTLAGDFKMVTEWPRFSFVVRNPYQNPQSELDQPSPTAKYVGVERNNDQQPV
jgi:hypothetical protein